MKIALGSDQKTHLTDFLADELERRGHELVVPGPWARELGCAMLLSRDAGSWQVVADQRRENAVAGF